MNHATLGISLIALIPAMLLCAFIYFKDKTEKEPLWLLAILFFAGAVGFIPSLFAEQSLASLIDSLFQSKMEFSFDGRLTYITRMDKISHLSLISFAVALVEEAVKWLLLFFITRKNKNFNYLFDGIVYSTFVAMGFAAVENVRYALIDGWDTLFLRAVTSVPGHLFFGIFMGYCYTVWHTYSMAENIEKDMLAKGKIKERKVKGAALWLVLSIILPVLVHAVYSFAGAYNSKIVTYAFYVFVIILYIFCFIRINKMSKKDAQGQRIAYSLVLGKHFNIEANISKLADMLKAKEEKNDE